MLKTLQEHLGHVVHRTLPTLEKHLVSEPPCYPGALITQMGAHTVTSPY